MIGLGDACTNTGLYVREILHKYHRLFQEIDADDPINYAFEFYEEVLDAPPLRISGSHVKELARYLGGAAVLGGAGAKFLKDWCTCF